MSVVNNNPLQSLCALFSAVEISSVFWNGTETTSTFSNVIINHSKQLNNILKNNSINLSTGKLANGVETLLMSRVDPEGLCEVVSVSHESRTSRDIQFLLPVGSIDDIIIRSISSFVQENISSHSENGDCSCLDMTKSFLNNNFNSSIKKCDEEIESRLSRQINNDNNYYECDKFMKVYWKSPGALHLCQLAKKNEIVLEDDSTVCRAKNETQVSDDSNSNFLKLGRMNGTCSSFLEDCPTEISTVINLLLAIWHSISFAACPSDILFLDLLPPFMLHAPQSSDEMIKVQISLSDPFFDQLDYLWTGEESSSLSESVKSFVQKMKSVELNAEDEVGWFWFVNGIPVNNSTCLKLEDSPHLNFGSTSLLSGISHSISVVDKIITIHPLIDNSSEFCCLSDDSSFEEEEEEEDKLRMEDNRLSCLRQSELGHISFNIFDPVEISVAHLNDCLQQFLIFDLFVFNGSCIAACISRLSIRLGYDNYKFQKKLKKIFKKLTKEVSKSLTPLQLPLDSSKTNLIKSVSINNTLKYLIRCQIMVDHFDSKVDIQAKILGIMPCLPKLMDSFSSGPVSGISLLILSVDPSDLPLVTFWEPSNSFSCLFDRPKIR